jgi:hypothetical protein
VPHHRTGGRTPGVERLCPCPTGRTSGEGRHVGVPSRGHQGPRAGEPPGLGRGRRWGPDEGGRGQAGGPLAGAGGAGQGRPWWGGGRTPAGRDARGSGRRAGPRVPGEGPARGRVGEGGRREMGGRRKELTMGSTGGSNRSPESNLGQGEVERGGREGVGSCCAGKET